jgi:hypothetical protein
MDGYRDEERKVCTEMKREMGLVRVRLIFRILSPFHVLHVYTGEILQ